DDVEARAVRGRYERDRCAIRRPDRIAVERSTGDACQVPTVFASNVRDKDVREVVYRGRAFQRTAEGDPTAVRGPGRTSVLIRIDHPEAPSAGICCTDTAFRAARIRSIDHV